MYVIVGLSTIIVLALIVFLLMVDLSGSVNSSPTRACPICGRKLDQDERLYADELTRESGPDELKIKGCTHCYKNVES
jgi:hypothetical protein